MKLITAENIRLFNKFPIGSQEKVANPKIIVKFFCPWNAWTWYATEAEYQEQEDDWLFFGLVEGLEKELGYFVLSELQSVTGPGGLKIERDMHFKGNLDDVRK